LSDAGAAAELTGATLDPAPPPWLPPVPAELPEFEQPASISVAISAKVAAMSFMCMSS
jgi:hypothetical protein